MRAAVVTNGNVTSFLDGCKWTVRAVLHGDRRDYFVNCNESKRGIAGDAASLSVHSSSRCTDNPDVTAALTNSAIVCWNAGAKTTSPDHSSVKCACPPRSWR